MSSPIVFRAVARTEADDTAQWYEGQRAGLGDDFVVELQRIVDEIGSHPSRYPLVSGDTRQATLTRFPYCVYYRVRPGRVIVTAVLHASRDPSIWQSRS